MAKSEFPPFADVLRYPLEPHVIFSDKNTPLHLTKAQERLTSKMKRMGREGVINKCLLKY